MPGSRVDAAGFGRSILVHSRGKSRHGGRTQHGTLILAPGLSTLLKKYKKAQDSWV